MSYHVQLEVFEGPLDLLLHLIKMEEIDIYDVPIARIADQYLEYLHLMRLLDLEVAGDFLVMAATLMRIKARMLLPRAELEEEEEDPREQLIQQLVEYRRFKELASKLREREEMQRNLFPRSGMDSSEDDISPAQIGLFELLTAFKVALDRQSPESFHLVAVEEVTIDQRIGHIQRILREREQVKFTDLFSDDSRRLAMIVTFIALLELIRRREILVKQVGLFSEIWVMSR